MVITSLNLQANLKLYIQYNITLGKYPCQKMKFADL